MPESPNLQLEPCASAESSSFYLKYEIHLCIFCLSKIVSPAALSGLCTKMKIWKLTQKNSEFWYLLKIKWLENRKEQITTCNSKFFFVLLWYLYFLNPMSLKREAFKFAITELSTFSGASETLFGQYCLQLKRLPRSYCLPLESRRQPFRTRKARTGSASWWFFLTSSIPDICNFFYTGSIFKFQILHPKID